MVWQVRQSVIDDLGLVMPPFDQVVASHESTSSNIATIFSSLNTNTTTTSMNAVPMSSDNKHQSDDMMVVDDDDNNT
jgi:hypothetical protein